MFSKDIKRKLFFNVEKKAVTPKTLNSEIHKHSVRIKAPNSVNASKRKHKNQINHYNKQRRVFMANSTVCQSK